MANSLTTRVANIVFNTKGVNAVLNYQKQLVKDKKQQLDIQKQLVDSMNGTEKTYAAEVKTLNKLTAEWKKLEKEEQTFKSDLNAVTSTINNMGEASPRAINKLNSALARMSKNMGSMTAEAKEKFDALVGAIKPVTEALSQKFQKGFSDMMAFKPNTATWAELNNYVKEYNQNGRILAEVSNNEAKAFADMGAKAAKCMIEMGKMDGTLTKLSADADPTRIREYIAAWQKIQNFQGSNATIKAGAQNAIERGSMFLAQQNSNMLRKGTGTPEEMKKAQQELQNYINTTKLAESTAQFFQASIIRGQKHIENYGKNNNLGFFRSQMQEIRILSKDALADNKKYWQGMVDGATKGTAAYKEYSSQLQKTVAEEERRTRQLSRQNGASALGKTMSGAYTQDTATVQKMIADLEKFKTVINQKTEGKLFKDVTYAIDKLKQDLVDVSDKVRAAKKYLADMKSAEASGKPMNFSGTLGDLERIKQGLMDMKKHLREAGDAEGVQRLEKALINVDADIRSIGIDSKRMQEIINNPKGVYSIKELEAAYEKLKAQIGRAGISQEDFNKKAAQMKAIKGQINELTAQYKLQNSTLQTNKSLIASLGTNLKNIILHYIGLQMVMMRIFAVIKDNVNLSDQMTNISKVTGMASGEVVELTKAIYDIDTRTANDQLMQLAEQAGKLGIATRAGAEGVRSFVEVGNMITNTLGDIGGAEAITELLKVNDVINKDSKGIEQDLNNIGSAILNVGNNSKATYQAVTEYTKRMGPVGKATGLAMQEVMGLGGAFSSLGVDAAMAATATQRVMFGIKNNIEGVAKVVNLSTAELTDLINGGNMMEAFYRIMGQLEGDTQKMDAFFKVLGGRYNMQARSAITLLSQNLGTLQYQVNLANQGFADGTLVEEEYNKANNNLAGVLARIGNEFQEMFTSVSASNGIFASTARVVLSTVQTFRELNVFAVMTATTFVQLIIAGASWIKTAYSTAVATAVANKSFTGFGGTLASFATMFIAPLQVAYYKLTGNITAATAAQKAFNTAWKSNAIGIIITVITAAATAMYNYYQKTKQAAEEQKKLTDRSEEEISALKSLKQRIEETTKAEENDNAAKQRRLNLIMEFNKRAGQYLNNLLTEKNYATQLAIAYEKAASAIHRKNAEQDIEEGNKAAKEASREGRASADEDLKNAIGHASTKGQRKNPFKGFTDEQRDDMAAEMESVIKSYFEDDKRPASEKTVGKAMDYLRKQMGTRLQYQAEGTRGGKRGIYTFDYLSEKSGGDKAILNALKDYAKAMEKGEKERRPYTSAAGVESRQATQADKNAYNKLYSQFFDSKTGSRRNVNGMLLADQYKDVEEWFKLAQQLGMEGTTAFKNMTHLYNDILKDYQPWGTPSANPEEMSKEELSKILDFFNRLGNAKTGQQYLKTDKNGNTQGITLNIPAGVELPSNINSMSAESVRKWAWDQWSKWQKIQDEKNHATTGGDFKPERDSNRSKKDTTQQEMEDARKHLEEYYKRREEMATNALNEGKTTEDAYNAYILANNQEMLKNQEILEQKFLDKNKKFTNDSVNEWMKSIEGVDGKKITINYSKIESYLADKGKHLVGKVRDNAAKYAAELTASIRKNNKEIEKLLLDERPIAKVAQSFMEDLNKMNLMFTEVNNEELMTSNTAQQMAADRLTFLMEEAKKGYSLTAEQFIKDMRAYDNGSISPWADALVLDQDKLNMLLIKTQGFMEQYEDAVRKMITKVGKRIEQEWAEVNPDTGKSLNQETEDSKMKLENSMKQQSLADSWGFTGNNLAGIGDTDKLQMEQLQQAIELEKERFRIIKERYDYELAAIREKLANETDPMVRAQLEAEAQATQTAALRATEEQLKSLTEARKAESDAQLKLMSKTVDQIRPYYDNLNTFAQSFGENIFGSKEDRKKAAKELLISTIETTGKMLTQWLVYIATKKIYDKMEEYQNIKHQQTMLAQTLMYKAALLQSEGQDALAHAAIKEAEGAVDAASAAGKEAAKAGWVGMAIGAALSLAMTVAMAAATSKLKQTVSTTTGTTAGKLTTGMLTYAEGRYPTYAGGMMNVQGNDGRSYNAVVKPNLTTGEYNRPHLGIVGERGAELIVDHPTFSRLKTDAPWILKGIYDMKRFGTTRLNHDMVNKAMKTLALQRSFVTHASGNIEQALASVSAEQSLGNSGTESNQQMQDTLLQLANAITNLQERGVQGHFNVYGDDGLVNSYDKGKKFMTSVGK